MQLIQLLGVLLRLALDLPAHRRRHFHLYARHPRSRLRFLRVIGGRRVRRLEVDIESVTAR